MSQFVYIINGSTGEYDDRSEWIVAATLSEDLANQILDKCQNEYQNALNQAAQAAGYFYVTKAVNELIYYLGHPFKEPKEVGIMTDKHFHISHPGTYYSINKIPLIDNIN